MVYNLRKGVIKMNIDLLADNIVDEIYKTIEQIPSDADKHDFITILEDTIEVIKLEYCK